MFHRSGGGVTRCCKLALWCCAIQAGLFSAASAGERADQENANGEPIVARVDAEPVYRSEVERELRQAYGDDVQVAQVPAETWQRAAEQVVKRRLMLEYLKRSKQGASQQDIDFALEQLKKELKAQNVTFEEYLRRGGWREEEFLRSLAWTLSWQRFLERTTTEANLQKYFQSHTADFDGREVRVAHLLLKVEAGDQQGLAKRLEEAKKIREEIESRRLDFGEAVKKHSEAPSAATSGGDLGFIRRREPMPEAFSQAAFALRPGELSMPVVTSFGVHLIRCLEVRPGKLTWRDSEAELRKAVALYLFEWGAEKQRSVSKVEWMAREKTDEAKVAR